MLAASAAVLLGAQQSAEEVLEHEPPEIVERLQRGRILMLEDVEAESESFMIAYVVFGRPREHVVSLMKQAERQPEYRPELKSVRTVERFEEGRVDEQRLRIMFRELVYRLRYSGDPASGRVEWELDPGFDNDLRRMSGFWELYAFANGTSTLGRFGSSVDVGGNVPGFIQKGMSRKTVLRYVQNFRRWVESDGKWRP